MRKIQPQQQYDMATGQFVDNPRYKPRASRKATNPTTVLTDQVIKYVRSHDSCDAWRISTQGIYREGVGLIQNKSMKGLPDIMAIVYGRYVGIEIKWGKDIQSEAQKAVEARIKATGGAYLIVSEFETFKALFDDYMAAKQKQLSIKKGQPDTASQFTVKHL
jgi:hypothetical protein